MRTRLWRELDFNFKMEKKNVTFGAAPDLCGRVRTVDAARMFFDLV